MNARSFRPSVAAGAASLLLILGAAPAWAAADSPDKPREQAYTVVVGAGAAQAEDEPAHVTVEVQAVQPGKYWIGVVGTALDDALVMNQLDLEYGFVVTEVVEGSPAAKAGLQKQDILVQVNDKPLQDIKALAENVEEAKETEITLTLVRKGQKQTVQLTPAVRPSGNVRLGASPDQEAVAEWKQLQETLKKHGALPQTADEGPEEGTKMLFVMPGFVLPEKAQDFPKNLEVTITKKGEGPARITVKRGDEQWEVDADSLDKLPEDIRPHIKQMLGGGLSVTFGAKGMQWSSELPKPLVLPHLTPESLKKSFKVSPELNLELKGWSERLPEGVWKKIEKRLQDAQVRVEEAQTKVPSETLEKIEKELKDLRQQLEKLQAERAKKAEREEEDQDEEG